MFLPAEHAVLLRAHPRPEGVISAADLTSMKTTDAFTCGSMDGKHAKHSFRRDHWDEIH